jgi:DNA/RNA endonuclease YhcR with UshA esterase domain
MKSFRAIALAFATLVLIFVIVVLMAAVPTAVGQNNSLVTVPKYDAASEATFKGTVIDVVDRQCPMSGGLGSHLNLKLEDGKTIEVHLATTAFVKSFNLVFNKGDKVEVVGVKVQFEGKETIFAREVTRGTDTFTFRNKNGEPAW